MRLYAEDQTEALNKLDAYVAAAFDKAASLTKKILAKQK
jgi:hypothetical protein